MKQLMSPPRVSVWLGAGLLAVSGLTQAGWIQDDTYTNLWVGDGAQAGLVYDFSQELIWLQDANYAKTSGYDWDGYMTWDAALAWAAGLDFGGYDDWRLWEVTDTDGPDADDLGNDGRNDTQNLADDITVYNGSDYGYNIDTDTSELGHLWYDTLGNLSYYDTSGNPQPGSDLKNTGPFDNFAVSVYWSGTMSVSGTAWWFGTGAGNQNYTDSYYIIYERLSERQAWAVRPGRIDVASSSVPGSAQVPVPGTLWLTGLGLLGLSLGRRRQVIRRFK